MYPGKPLITNEIAVNVSRCIVFHRTLGPDKPSSCLSRWDCVVVNRKQATRQVAASQWNELQYLTLTGSTGDWSPPGRHCHLKPVFRIRQNLIVIAKSGQISTRVVKDDIKHKSQYPLRCTSSSILDATQRKRWHHHQQISKCNLVTDFSQIIWPTEELSLSAPAYKDAPLDS